MSFSLSRRSVMAGGAALLGAATTHHLAKAQSAWPNRPIRMVVAWPPGGGADVPARLVAGPMQRSLGQPIVIENRGGASGSIGAAAVAQAAPDGYTVLAHTSSIIGHALLTQGLDYDPAKVFAPVAKVVISPLLMVVRPDYPAQNLAELLEIGRRTPGGILYASSGTAAGTHLAGAMLLRRAGVPGVHVNYRGGAQSAAAILGGDAVFTFSTLPQATPLVREGRLRALAVATAERIEALPEVPTVAEQGFPGFEMSEWLGFWVPAGTPAEPIAQLEAATLEALKDPEVRQRLGQIGMIPAGLPAPDFAHFMAVERAKLAELIRDEGIRLE